MAISDEHAKRGKTPRLSPAEVASLRGEVPGWAITPVDAHEELRRTLTFEDFNELWSFLNLVVALAVDEDHHPDFAVHYNRLDLVLWTHDAGGLTRNDFIVAARIAQLADQLGF